MEEIDDVAARTAAAVANFMFVFLFLICGGCCSMLFVSQMIESFRCCNKN